MITFACIWRRTAADPRSRKRLVFPLLTLLALICGCAQDPFTRPPLPVLKNPDASAIRETFPRLLPEQFTSEDTVIIQAPFRDDMAVLTVAQVDRAAGTFRLVGMHQMGISVFDVGGKGKELTIYSAIPQLMEHKDILLSLARDFQHIYFDLAPSSSAQMHVHQTEVDFEQKTPDGTLEFQFGYEPAVLLEKRLTGLFGTIWHVRYYDYQSGPGNKSYPHGIVMDNGQYHYRIIVKNRNWSVEPS